MHPRSTTRSTIADRLRAWCSLLLCLAGTPVAAQDIGSDLTGLTLCLYGDCEARGSYAADPYGWWNPATMPVGTLPYVPRGVFAGLSWFRPNVGTVSGNIWSGGVTGAWDPALLQVQCVHGEAGGGIPDTPGTKRHFRTDSVRNPLSRYLRVYLITGVDTNGGWGLGAGLYGNGPLEFASCNPAYSSRPMAESLGDRFNLWSANCAVSFGF